MAVKEAKELTEEQKTSDEGQRSEAESKAKESIIKNTLDTLDLSAVESIRNKTDDAKEKPEAEEEEESTEETSDEVEGEETTDEETEEAEGEETEEKEEGEEDGDLVPKSKVQKRFNSLNARLKALEDENAQLKNKTAEPVKDEDTKKLEGMSLEALKATKREVIVAQRKEQDEDRLRKLVDLEDKVNGAINSFGDRFVGSQVTEFNKVAERIQALGEIELTKEIALELKGIASDIYNSNPELKGIVRGQAIALELAYKHYKALGSRTAGKEKVDELKRQNNTLKRKTSLDSAGLKGKGKDVQLGKLRSKAFRGGDTNDRINLIKNDPQFGIDNLIPDEYK